MKQFLRVQLLVAICLLLIPLAAISQNQGSKSDQPAQFPKMKSSGNSEADRINYEKAVKEWNDSERKRLEQLRKSEANRNISPSPVAKVKSNAAGNQAERNAAVAAGKAREITILDLPGYPKYIVTGDPLEDEKVYQAAKTKWMNENQTAYDKYVKEHSASSAKSGNLRNRKKVERSN
jgi:hypothetical protein